MERTHIWEKKEKGMDLFYFSIEFGCTANVSSWSRVPVSWFPFLLCGALDFCVSDFFCRYLVGLHLGLLIVAGALYLQ